MRVCCATPRSWCAHRFRATQVSCVESPRSSRCTDTLKGTAPRFNTITAREKFLVHAPVAAADGAVMAGVPRVTLALLTLRVVGADRFVLCSSCLPPPTSTRVLIRANGSLCTANTSGLVRMALMTGVMFLTSVGVRRGDPTITRCSCVLWPGP